MNTVKPMRILTFGLERENQTSAILPSMTMEEVKSLESLQKKSISLSIALIVLSENEAEEALSMLVPYRDQMIDTEIVVVCSKVTAQVTRQWTAIGAAEVWPQSSWIQSLIQYGGGGDVQMIPQVPIDSGETKVIAVSTVFSGAGSTYLSLMLATYLKKKYKAKVAIWEGGVEGRESLRTLQFILNGRTPMADQLDRLYYNIAGISFFDSTVDDQTLEAVQQEFDYIIYDMGELLQTENELLFFRAHVPILIGSGAQYRLPDPARVINKFQHRRNERVQVVIPFGSKSTISELQQIMPGRLIHALPIHYDPLEVEAESSDVLAALLSSVLSKPKKRTAKLFNFGK